MVSKVGDCSEVVAHHSRLDDHGAAFRYVVEYAANFQQGITENGVEGKHALEEHILATVHFPLANHAPP